MALLRYAMIGIGLIFVAGIWTLSAVWPSGWSWGVGPSHYWPMILGVYATLGIFLVWARAIRWPTAVSSGSRCGRAWCTRW